MSGLTEALSMAARAMQAQSFGLETVGQNMANLNTPGYARRLAQFAEVPPGSGGGVRIVGAPAQRDALVEARLRRELPMAGQQMATAEALSVVETTLGGIGSSLDANLTAFFDSWQALSQDPTSPVARDNVVQQGRLLGRAFNDISSRLQQSQHEADLQVRASVADINALTSSVTSLNGAIARANGADAEALKDQLGEQLDRLAELVNVTVLHNRDGSVDVTLASGRALVVGENQYQLGVGTAPVTGLATVTTSDGVDITAEITGGKVAGYLDVRDTHVPSYLAQLDQLAYDVSQQVNTLHQAGFDLAGGTGHAFFAPLGAVAGAASGIALDAGVAGDPTLIAASQTGTVGDNQVADALARLRDATGAAGGTATFAQAWSQIVYHVGNDSATAQADQASRETIVSAVERLRDSVSGVSLDEEAAAMIKYQRAYEANAKFFAAVGDTLDTLLQIV
ncbi:MAG: flagellar hook-associated protein FlgK [Vicinamibacterales bacterium]